jgi:subtilisin family serine protease
MESSLPLEYPSDNPVPESILGYVSVQGARSVFGQPTGPLPDLSEAYRAENADRDQVRRNLEESEFTVYAESPLGFAVVGSPAAFEDLTGGTVEAKERLMQAEGGRVRYVTHLDIVGDRQPETLSVAYAESEAAKIDGVLLERPRIAMEMFPSPIPPSSPKFHLSVPADVSTLLSASEAHRQGFSGDDVLVAMPDSGFFRHPYFIGRHYAVRKPITVVPGTNPNRDPHGHGTGESANVFAVAPGAVLQPIRASNSAGDLVGAIGGFLRAKDLNPKIITNSWGGDGPFPPDGDPDEFDRAFALEILDTIERGILVVFSAGNSHFSIEPQVPGVLAAGGVHMSTTLESRASNYASGYQSPWFDGVTVPTVCGLVGLRPRAQYIMLPVPPGSPLDVGESEPSTVPFDPTDDGTAPNDGWALFSGTSAAAPQLAGAAALILGVRPDLEPAQVIEALSETAIDITTGSCHPRFNNPATVGHDLATGRGLVNAAAAVKYAMEEF